MKIKRIENKVDVNKIELQSDPCKYYYERRKLNCLYDCCCDCRPVNDRCSAYKDTNY